MKVFKLGGSCIRNPEAVKKLEQLVQSEPLRPLIVVISAMGKTTQILESVFQQKLHERPYETTLQKLYRFYQEMIDALLCQTQQTAHRILTRWLEELITTLSPPLSMDSSLDKLYSKIVAEGRAAYF